MNWWRTKKLLYLFQKLSCTALCTARQQPSTTRQRSRQRSSDQLASKAQSSLPAAFQPTGSQSSSAQVLNRGRPEPDSSSSDSVTSNWSKLHFFKKNKCCQNAQIGEKIGSKLKNNFVPFKRYLHTAQKSSKSLFGRAPPAEKPYRIFFSVQLLRPLFSSKLVKKAQKTMKLSLIYEDRPQGPPTGPIKKWSFWPNSDLEKISRPERKISMIRDGEDPGASSSNSQSVAPLPPVQRTGERNSPPSNLGFVEMSQSALPRMVGRN